MKLLVIIVFLMPLAVAAQTANSYQHTMEKFRKFYNAGQGDSINAMFGHGWDEMKSTTPLWTNAQAAEYKKEYGSLRSFKFIGVDTLDPNRVYVFKTFFSKAGARTTSLTLDKDNGLGTFRFITTSEGIDQLLSNTTKRR